MRLAVLYHLPNPGGFTRFTDSLLGGLLRADASLEVDYFVAEQLAEQTRLRFAGTPRLRCIVVRDPSISDSNLDVVRARSALGRLPAAAGSHLERWPRVHDVVQQAYRSSRDWIAATIGLRHGKHWQQFALTGDLRARLGGYDVVYLPFPYYLEPTSIDAPLVATFHDFNYLYFPGNFGRGLRARLDTQIRYWTSRADAAVVSTHFIEADLSRHYPGAAGRSRVIYVAPYSRGPVPDPLRLAILQRFRVRDAGFILYPANHSYHKNLLGLVAGADLLKRRLGRMEYPVLITGFGTDGLGRGTWPSLSAADRFLQTSVLELGEDVRGLGFVSDDEVDALTQSARLVVSTSLYEAGCGPALDAWQYGVPVAFSRIPPFLEQLQALGVEARTFDPTKPDEVAVVIEEALRDREGSLSMARRSRQAIRAHTWESAAVAYLDTFHTAIAHHNSTRE